MKYLIKTLLIFILISCNTNEKYDKHDISELQLKYSNNIEKTENILTSTYAVIGDSISHGVKTLINLKKLREHFISKLLKETKYSTLTELLENKPLELFNETKNTKKTLNKNTDRLFKFSILVFNDYSNFERLLNNNVDSISVQEVLTYKEKDKGFQALKQIIQRYLDSYSSNDLYLNLLFIEEFHSDLISSIIELNSLEKSVYSQDLPEEIIPIVEPYSKDSVKIYFKIGGKINSSNLSTMWSYDPKFNTRKTAYGEYLVISKDQDSIYGESRFYKTDTVYWKPWVASIQHGLTTR